MNAIYRQELVKNTALYQKLITDSYRRSIFAIQQRAGIAFPFSDVNPKLMDRLLHSKWSGKNYSVRLWGNTQEVAENVKEQIILGALTGKTEREMAEALNGTFAKGARVSRRLIRTESNYIFTQADMAARKECDIRRYMYLATLDMKTCAETCGTLDGRIFLVKDQKPGYNCPPMHPWCRCTTLSVLSDEWIRTQTRRARDPKTGRTYKVPLSMTYEEWKKLITSSELINTQGKADLMAAPKQTKSIETPFGQLKVKRYKKFDNDIWTENNNASTRQTAAVIDDLVTRAKAKIPENVEVPRIVIVDKNHFKRGQYGGYNYQSDTIFYPNIYYSREDAQNIVNNGYFGGTSETTLILHEVGHKVHWDKAKKLYNASLGRYTSIEDAKHALDENLISAIKRKIEYDPSFVSRNVSKNADEGLVAYRTINEFQADLFVRKCDGTVSEELKQFLEDFDNDGLTH
ncbi:MAG: minor capsid protein [Lachnospira sp.]|nr:minor capsid protein [Lachnospira sp.]